MFVNKIAAELRELQCRKSARRAPTVSLLNGKEEQPTARGGRLEIPHFSSHDGHDVGFRHGVDFHVLQFSGYRLADKLPTVHDRIDGMSRRTSKGEL